MKRTPQPTGDRLPLLITIGLFVVMLALVPLALRLDEGVDNDRSLYQDMEKMQAIQEAYVASGERPIETQLTEGETVRIGKKKFTASDGISLAVRSTGESSFCITASNQNGAESERCID